jgi:hypothetical protein
MIEGRRKLITYMEWTDRIRLGTKVPIVDPLRGTRIKAGVDVWPLEQGGENRNGYGAGGDSKVACGHGNLDAHVG